MLSESVQEELLSLSYIYPDSYARLTESSFQILLSYQDYSLRVEIHIPANYPNKERPSLIIKELSANLSRSYLVLWTTELDRWMEKNWTPSQPILYDMICQLQEKLEALNRRENQSQRSKSGSEGPGSSQGANSSHPESIVYHESDASGNATEPIKTPVTLASFMAWRAAFEQECSERDALEKENQSKENNLKPTGRQLFETDRTLMLKGEESEENDDAVFDDQGREENEESVDAMEIDSSLFSRLEEIEGEPM